VLSVDERRCLIKVAILAADWGFNEDAIELASAFHQLIPDEESRNICLAYINIKCGRIDAGLSLINDKSDEAAFLLKKLASEESIMQRAYSVKVVKVQR
jgi:HD-like signal output (HDOD) protein